MPRDLRHDVATASLAAVAAVVGLVAAAIVTFNVHIAVGLEQGYAATPAEVLEYSVLLLAFDLVLLLLGPVLAIVLVLRMRRGDWGG